MPVINAPGRQAGYSLIEFMIAGTLSLIVLAALTALFVGNMRARDELSRSNQQMENGRFAQQLLTDDLQLAGFFGEFDMDNAMGQGMAAALPAAKPDPCVTTLANLRTDFPLHVQGYDQGAALSCVSADRKANVDMLVVRRVSTCVAGVDGCADLPNVPYFQASLCSSNTELNTPGGNGYLNFFRLDTEESGNLDRNRRDCTTDAVFRRYRTHIYFVASNDATGDGIPTLKRAELGAGGFTVVSLVHGIEDLQIEYGIDTDNDGGVDDYTANPDVFDGCAGAANPCAVTNWMNVMAVRMHILARSVDASPFHVESKTYRLGLDADGGLITFTPATGDAFKRLVFQTLVRLNNAVVRRR